MKNLIPTLQEVFYVLTARAREETAQAPAPANKELYRFSVTVKPETRMFLETQSAILNNSIAGLAGSILDGVGLATANAGSQNPLQQILDRFHLILKEHGLSIPAAAEALSVLEFQLSDFETNSALLKRLDGVTLRRVAEIFFIRYPWLVGDDIAVNQIVDHAWYKNVRDAASRLLTATRSATGTRLLIVTSEDADFDNKEDSDWDSATHFVPILKVEKRLPCGELFVTFQQWDSGRWSYWRSRHHLKLLIYFCTLLTQAMHGKFSIDGVFVSKPDYKRLTDGRVMTCTAFNGSKRNVWYPEDFVDEDSSVAKDRDEWRTIKGDEDNQSTLAYFNNLLKR
jgi:hypothetical protein